jgi:adenosylmethionine-8-amino-7-oxononanoate aminotransferase
MTLARSPLWHPFTQHALAAPELFIERAAGSYLYTKDGRAILDAISSWWVNIYGHCHPKIVEAVQRQSAKLEQVIFAGFTHEPAEELAQSLLKVTHNAFSNVFLSDSGSTSVEVALKMAIGYWHHQGLPRKKIIALEDGYHGDTFGAMSVGERSVFNAGYEPFLFDVMRLPFPKDESGANTLAALETILSGYADDVAAIILEPLVLGAGRMRMYAPPLFKALVDRARSQGILVIADEVMTGWGRTGTRFAYEQAGAVPDILCLSKGLTGGFLPLGATLATGAIYQSFYSTDRRKTFFHSSSFTGNALACAAANAAIAIWEDEGVEKKISRLSAFHKKALARLGGRADIANLRQIGTIAAFDIVGDESGYLANIGPELYRFFLENNVLLRPLGNTIYIMPPYCFSDGELETVYDTIGRALDRFAGSGKNARESA